VPKAAVPGSRWPHAFYLAIAANLFYFASFQWSYVTLPGFIQELGGGAAEIGLAFGLSTLSAVLVRPVIGPLIDRRGPKAALLFGSALFVVEPVLYTLVDSFAPFLALRLLRGLSLAAFTTAYTVLIAALAPPERRGEAVGLAGVTNNLGMLFAPALGAAVQERWGYTLHFYGAAALALVSLVLLLPLRQPRSASRTVQAGPGFRSVGRLRAVWLASLAGTGLAVGYGAALSFMPPLAAERGLQAAGGYFTAFALAMMASQASAGWLSDRVGRRAVALPGMVLAALASAAVALAWSDLALLAAGAGLGLSWGLVRASLDASLVDSVPSKSRGAAFAFLYTCFDAGIGAGAYGLGLLAEARGYAAAFYAAATVAAVVLAGYLALSRPGAARRGGVSSRDTQRGGR
jgi:MFS family permease